MPDTYTSQFSGEEIDSALRAAQMISGASTPAELRKKLEIRGDTIPVSATDPTPVSEALTASGGGVNPNLLDNWFFGNPVNQRGQTEYTAVGYTVDRWKLDIDIGTVAVESDGIVLDGGSTGCTLYELQEPALLSMLEGQILTFSAMYTILSQTGSPGGFGTTVPGSYVARCIFGGSVGVKNVASGSAVMPTNLQSVSWFYIPAGCKIKIHAVKVELGDTQTLAHKENGAWVLNEIPDFGEQLRRCQRYYLKLEQNTVGVGSGIENIGGAIVYPIYFPTTMRTEPAVTVSNSDLVVDYTHSTGCRIKVQVAGWRDFDLTASADL